MGGRCPFPMLPFCMTAMALLDGVVGDDDDGDAVIIISNTRFLLLL